MNASPANHNIQKALKIIGTDETARLQLAIPSLHQRGLVAGSYSSVQNAHKFLPSRSSSHDPLCETPTNMHQCSHTPSCTISTLSIPVASTNSLNRSFVYAAVRVWNSLPDDIDGGIEDSGTQAFKRRAQKQLLNSRIE